MYARLIRGLENAQANLTRLMSSRTKGPDPAEWVQRGYAVVNIDARGAGHSEGYIAMWGHQVRLHSYIQFRAATATIDDDLPTTWQEAEDIYDVIDWLSKQPWCNGSVCMASVTPAILVTRYNPFGSMIIRSLMFRIGLAPNSGNSWLAISQVNFASRLSHPALKALAPWEAYTDPYRDFVARGGRAHIPGFHRMIEGGFAGKV